MTEIDPERPEYWQCTIGPIKRGDLGWGADFPLRKSVKDKFEELFNTVDYNCSSGWGITEELNSIMSRIRLLYITDRSGETLNKIKKALAENSNKLDESKANTSTETEYFLSGFIRQFNEELDPNDFTALDFLNWLDLNSFEIIKKK